MGVEASITTFGPGDVRITEAMPVPEASVLATGPSRRAAGEAPSLLGALAPSSSLLAVRAVRDPPCLAALDRLERVCATKAVAALCARSFLPNVANRGAFTSCSNEGLQDYFPAVTDYNERCVRLGFPERPTHGPPGPYLLPGAGRGPDAVGR